MSNDLIATQIEEKKDLIKSLYCKGLDDKETEHFFIVCRKLDLNPLAKQIYVYKMGGKMTIIVSIDGLRLVADRTKEYAPGKETCFKYKEDGEKLLCATAYVKKLTKDGQWHEISATAFLDEYNTNQNLWKKMPHVMLAKCAEAQALRRAFPAELSGVYTKEEMDQAKMEDQNTEIVIEPKEDITVEKSSEIMAESLGIENDSALKEYIISCKAKTNMSLQEITDKWIQQKDKFISYFTSWKEKR